HDFSRNVPLKKKLKVSFHHVNKKRWDKNLFIIFLDTVLSLRKKNYENFSTRI
ncbi:unnamed protein product, partial [Larinioides sclopetarius]